MCGDRLTLCCRESVDGCRHEGRHCFVRPSNSVPAARAGDAKELLWPLKVVETFACDILRVLTLLLDIRPHLGDLVGTGRTVIHDERDDHAPANDCSEIFFEDR